MISDRQMSRIQKLRTKRQRMAAAAKIDWTIDTRTGRSNSSPTFNRLRSEIEQIIRGDARSLIAGRAQDTAGLIMAQLAHVHGLRPGKSR